MNVGVLASHEGTTLQSLLDAFAGGRIPGRVSVVVSNNGDSGALVKAREAGVQAVHLLTFVSPQGLANLALAGWAGRVVLPSQPLLLPFQPRCSLPQQVRGVLLIVVTVIIQQIRVEDDALRQRHGPGPRIRF